jgi:glycosyltransferase involved in cell wall biosynthesis
VSEGLANEFKNRYAKDYLVIRNLPVLQGGQPATISEKFLLYQGAVNEARGFEYLIPAMRLVNYRLVICGDGNFMGKLKALIAENGVTDKIELRGMLLPAELRGIALKATLGIGIAEKEGLNQFMALPNKFFEYMHAGLPQLSMAYPEYEKINARFRVAVLIDELSPQFIAETINNLMKDQQTLAELRKNALAEREVYCWQHEEKLLVDFYKKNLGIE